MINLCLYPLILFLEAHENKIARSKAMYFLKVFMNLQKTDEKGCITYRLSKSSCKCADYPKPIQILVLLVFLVVFLKYIF